MSSNENFNINVHRMSNILMNFYTNCVINLRSLTFAKNNIEKNVKERFLYKNYKERFERWLHL